MLSPGEVGVINFVGGIPPMKFLVLLHTWVRQIDDPDHFKSFIQSHSSVPVFTKTMEMGEEFESEFGCSKLLVYFNAEKPFGDEAPFLEYIYFKDIKTQANIFIAMQDKDGRPVMFDDMSKAMSVAHWFADNQPGWKKKYHSLPPPKPYPPENDEAPIQVDVEADLSKLIARMRNAP